MTESVSPPGIRVKSALGFLTDRLSIQPAPAPRREPSGPASDGNSHSDVRLEIRQRESGHSLGEFRLSFPANKAGAVEFQLTLNADHQDDGLVCEAAFPVFDYLFREEGIKLARKWAPPWDEVAARIAQALGMSEETLEIGCNPSDGQSKTRMSYILTRARWEMARRSSEVDAAHLESRASDLWVVTAFFNPAGYQRHREKYRVFRARLGVPLVAVELAYGPRTELGPGDADRLIRLRSSHVLWQKERLLNLAIEALPEEVRYVAWVDSDVIFERTNWADLTRDALQSQALVQPFSRVLDLPPGAVPGRSWEGRTLLTRRSLGEVCANGGFDPTRTSMNMLEVGSPGHAWAMRRGPLEEVGLYDALILGSGDNGMAMAALGHAEAFVASHRMNPEEARHYRQWASRFFEVTRGKVGFVPGDLYHLWHGNLSARGYECRYPGLQQFDFDPHEDLAVDDGGAWRWATPKPEMHRYVARYFQSRKEDG